MIKNGLVVFFLCGFDAVSASIQLGGDFTEGGGQLLVFFRLEGGGLSVYFIPMQPLQQPVGALSKIVFGDSAEVDIVT